MNGFCFKKFKRSLIIPFEKAVNPKYNNAIRRTVNRDYCKNVISSRISLFHWPRASCDFPLVSTFYVLITGCARAFVYSEKKYLKKNNKTKENATSGRARLEKYQRASNRR